MAKAKVDASEYYAKIGFLVNGNEQHQVFKPIVEYQIPDEQGKKNLKVEGQLVRDKTNVGVKYTIQGIKINLPNTDEIIDIDGHLTYAPKNYELDVKAKKGEHSVQLNGNIKNYDVKVEFKNTLNPIVNFKVNGHIENTNENVSYYEQFFMIAVIFWHPVTCYIYIYIYIGPYFFNTYFQ